MHVFGEKKHNRELVTYFLTLAGPDASSRLQKFKLRAWLKLFSRFSNPKALHATDTPREMYRSLISYPDRELQVACLSCLLAYKSPHLRHHEEKFTPRRNQMERRVDLFTYVIDRVEGPASASGCRRSSAVWAPVGKEGLL
jgi:hypothetical protein